MPDTNIFGEQLKRLRIDRGLTQKELGIQVGVILSHISRYECGTSSPRMAMLIKLADALGVSTDYLSRGK